MQIKKAVGVPLAPWAVHSQGSSGTMYILQVKIISTISPEPQPNTVWKAAISKSNRTHCVLTSDLYALLLQTSHPLTLHVDLHSCPESHPEMNFKSNINALLPPS